MYKSPKIRPAKSEEASDLSALAVRSKAYWGYDDDFMAACLSELTVSPEAVRRNPTYVIEADNRVMGFYMLSPIEDGNVELDYLFVEPDVIGRGYGKKLMEHAKAVGKARGSSLMIIQSDPNAEQFYRRVGGELIGHRPSTSIPGRLLPVLTIDLSVPQS